MAEICKFTGALCLHVDTPRSKIVVYGGEFAQTSEWNCFESLNWDLLQYASHQGMQTFVKALNQLLTTEPALYHHNFSYEGFEWQEADDVDQSIYVFQRKGAKASDTLVVAINLTPVYRENYRLGIPVKGRWKEIFNSDAAIFYGSDKLNSAVLETEEIAHQRQKQSISINLPPLGVTIFKRTTR